MFFSVQILGSKLITFLVQLIHTLEIQSPDLAGFIPMAIKKEDSTGLENIPSLMFENVQLWAFDNVFSF